EEGRGQAATGDAEGGHHADGEPGRDPGEQPRHGTAVPDWVAQPGGKLAGHDQYLARFEKPAPPARSGTSGNRRLARMALKAGSMSEKSSCCADRVTFSTVRRPSRTHTCRCCKTPSSAFQVNTSSTAGSPPSVRSRRSWRSKPSIRLANSTSWRSA